MSRINSNAGMRPRRVRRLLALMASGAILAGAGLGWGIGEAHADGVLNATETQYVARYGEFVVCASIDSVPTPATVLTVVRSIMQDGFSADNSVDILNASVLAYCDQHWPLLQRVGRMARGELA